MDAKAISKIKKRGEAALKKRNPTAEDTVVIDRYNALLDKGLIRKRRTRSVD